jgi:hypothetical protein
MGRWRSLLSESHAHYETADKTDKSPENAEMSASEATFVSFVSQSAVQPDAALDRDGIGEMVSWLTRADLPVAPFELRPGVRVVDADLFRARLTRDISAGPSGCRWLAAREDLAHLQNVVAGRSGV